MAERLEVEVFAKLNTASVREAAREAGAIIGEKTNVSNQRARTSKKTAITEGVPMMPGESAVIAGLKEGLASTGTALTNKRYGALFSRMAFVQRAESQAEIEHTKALNALNASEITAKGPTEALLLAEAETAATLNYYRKEVQKLIKEIQRPQNPLVAKVEKAATKKQAEFNAGIDQHLKEWANGTEAEQAAWKRQVQAEQHSASIREKNVVGIDQHLKEWASGTEVERAAWKRQAQAEQNAASIREKNLVAIDQYLNEWANGTEIERAAWKRQMQAEQNIVRAREATAAAAAKEIAAAQKKATREEQRALQSDTKWFTGMVAGLGGAGGPGQPGGMASTRQKMLAQLEAEQNKTRTAARTAGMMSGNPFQVISEISARISGMNKLKVSLAIADRELTLAARDVRQAGNNAAKLAQAEARYAAALDQARSARAKATGFGGIKTGIKDFAISNVLTSGLLFSSFQVISSAVELLVQQIDRITNPAKYLREELKGVAEAMKAAGGSTAYLKQLGLNATPRLTGMLSRVGEMMAFDETLTAVIDTIVAANKDLTPLSKENQITRFLDAVNPKDWGARAGLANQENANAFWKFLSPLVGSEPLFSQAEMLGGADFLKQKNIAKSNFEVLGFGKQYEDTLNKLVGSGMKLNDALDKAAEQTARTAMAELERQAAEQRRTTSLNSAAVTAVLAGRGAEFGVTPGAYGVTSSQFAQGALTRSINKLQARMAAASSGSQYASMQQTLRDARLNVLRAGVNRGNETGFDVAARIQEAKLQRRDTQKQIAQQRYMTGLQEQMNKKQEQLSELQFLESIDALLKAQAEAAAAEREAASEERREFFRLNRDHNVIIGFEANKGNEESVRKFIGGLQGMMKVRAL